MGDVSNMICLYFESIKNMWNKWYWIIYVWKFCDKFGSKKYGVRFFGLTISNYAPTKLRVKK